MFVCIYLFRSRRGQFQLSFGMLGLYHSQFSAVRHETTCILHIKLYMIKLLKYKHCQDAIMQGNQSYF